MKATGIVRRIDDYVIIRPSRNPLGGVSLILSDDFEFGGEGGMDWMYINMMREGVKNRTDCAMQSSYLKFPLE